MALPKSKQNGGSRASALENRHALVRHNRPSCRCNQSSGRKRAKLQSCLGRILRKGSLAFSPSLSKLFLLALDTGIGRRGGSATARPSPPKQAAVIRKAQRALLKTLLTGAPIITADQIRAKVKLPKGVDPRCFGCVPGRWPRTASSCPWASSIPCEMWPTPGRCESGDCAILWLLRSGSRAIPKSNRTRRVEPAGSGRRPEPPNRVCRHSIGILGRCKSGCLHPL